jgi:hypothetical protein
MNAQPTAGASCNKGIVEVPRAALECSNRPGPDFIPEVVAPDAGDIDELGDQ